MSKIPTAEEFFFDYSVDSEYDNLTPNCKQEIAYKALEFTKLHVQAALQAAASKSFQVSSAATDEMLDLVTKQSILNAYPDELIK